MRSKKLKVIIMCFTLILSMSLMAGCKDKDPSADKPEDIPEIIVKASDEPGNTAEASYDGFTAFYDQDKWYFDDSMNQFTLYYMDDLAEGAYNVSNVVVIPSSEFEGELTEQHCEELTGQMEAISGDGMEIKGAQIKALNGEKVIYYEMETTLTDEMIDLLIEAGKVTEADIEAAGGREYFKEQGSFKQVGIMAVIDGRIVSFTGTYNDSMDEVLEAMAMLIQSGSMAS